MARAARLPRPSNLGFQGRVQIRGLREYQDKLVDLGNDMLTKGCVTALAPGANVMKDAARAFAPVLQKPDPRRRAGTLRDAITAMHVKPGKYAVTYVIGVRMLASRVVAEFKKRTGRAGSENPNDPFYAPIVELSEMRGRPFMRPAFASSAQRAVNVAFDRLRSFTEAAIRRHRANP